MKDKIWDLEGDLKSLDDFLVGMGVVVVDKEWWDDAYRSIDRGNPIRGWDDFSDNVYEYRRRLDLINQYRIYRGMWKRNRMRPKGVSGEGVVAKGRGLCI